MGFWLQCSYKINVNVYVESVEETKICSNRGYQDIWWDVSLIINADGELSYTTYFWNHQTVSKPLPWSHIIGLEYGTVYLKIIQLYTCLRERCRQVHNGNCREKQASYPVNFERNIVLLILNIPYHWKVINLYSISVTS